MMRRFTISASRLHRTRKVDEATFNRAQALLGEQGVHVELIPTDNYPTGVGQMPVTVVAPAVNNAVARLTGVRLRESPMAPERVKKALG
jgi:hypothetical protein